MNQPGIPSHGSVSRKRLLTGSTSAVSARLRLSRRSGFRGITGLVQVGQPAGKIAVDKAAPRRRPGATAVEQTGCSRRLRAGEVVLGHDGCPVINALHCTRHITHYHTRVTVDEPMPTQEPVRCTPCLSIRSQDRHTHRLWKASGAGEGVTLTDLEMHRRLQRRGYHRPLTAFTEDSMSSRRCPCHRQLPYPRNRDPNDGTMMPAHSVESPCAEGTPQWSHLPLPNVSLWR